jgi:hypothetical protein
MAGQVGLTVHSPTHTNLNVTIAFSLPHPDHVTVKLFDPSGRVTATLVDKYLGSGAHSTAWDTRGLARGCYTVRMQAGSDTYAKSIPIVR